jgi:hypothetical protein
MGNIAANFVNILCQFKKNLQTAGTVSEYRLFD